MAETAAIEQSIGAIRALTARLRAVTTMGERQEVTVGILVEADRLRALRIVEAAR
jgi:hypothetical protein